MRERFEFQYIINGWVCRSNSGIRARVQAAREWLNDHPPANPAEVDKIAAMETLADELAEDMRAGGEPARWG
jgi:hypothetical protein